MASEAWFKDGKFVKSVDKGYSFRIDILEPREDGETFEVLDSCYFMLQTQKRDRKSSLLLSKRMQRNGIENYRSLLYDLLQADAVYKGDELYEADFDGVDYFLYQQ